MQRQNYKKKFIEIMLKREFFEAHKSELMELSRLSHGFTRRMMDKTGKLFTTRFFKSDQPTDENVSLVLDSAIEYFADQIPIETALLARKTELVAAYHKQGFGKQLRE
jgi:hypothetical protein